MKTTIEIDRDFLESLMLVKGLSEKEFAKEIGVSHSMVNRVMNGKRGAGNKFLFGIMNTFKDVSYGQLIKRNDVLTKGNRVKKKSA